VTLFTRPRLVRAARYATYAAIALVVLVVAAALVIPAVIDMRRVEAELQAKLSEWVHGEVAWEKLEIRLLPSPRGALSRVRAEIPGVANVRAAEVEARLRLLPLLRGRAEIASVILSDPVIVLEIAQSSSGEEREEAPIDPVEAYRSAIGAVRRFAPESVLEVENADLEVRATGLPPIRLRGLEALASTGSRGLEIEVSAKSEYWSRMKLTASVSFADLSGEARLEAAEIRPQVWLDHFLADVPVRVALPAADLRAQARTDGKEKLECDFDLGAASVEIARAAASLMIPDVALTGRVAAGRQEIAVQLKSARLSNPVIALEIARPSSGKEKPSEESPSDPVRAYRSAIEAVRRFAPESVLEIENAGLDVRAAGLPPIRLRGVELLAKTGSRGLEIEVSGKSEYWSRMKLTAGASFTDLSGDARLEAAEIRPQAWLDYFLAGSSVRVALPAANLRAQARTDGKEKLEGDFGLDAASVEIARAAARLQLPNVVLAGGVAAGRQEIAVQLKSARLGASRLGPGSLRYSLKDGALSTLTDFDLDLAQAMDGTRRLLEEEAGEALAAIQAITGRAQGQVKFEMLRSGWSTLVEIRKSDSSVAMKGLPGPVKLAGASVRVTGDSVKVERADVALLDARALASVTIGYGNQLRIEGAVSEGSVGENLLAWAWTTAGVPPHLALKAPVRFAVQRAAWSPKQPIELAATVAFDAGPNVGAELAWTPKSLDIRRATIKDAQTDATMALHSEKGLLEGRFSGSLQSASIGAALRRASVPSGGGSGDLRFRVDLKHPERFSVAGTLKGKAMDLSWLLARPVTIERVDLDADGAKLNIRQASVNWAGQRFALRGDLRRAADGAPIIDAQLESPGVVVDALLPRTDAKQPAVEKTELRPADEALWTQWPLPVRGRISVRTDFIQYGQRKAEPVVAALLLDEQRASLELQEVRLCGISLPLTVEATPQGLAIAVRFAAQKQQLEQTARCLTEQGLLITGDFDLQADLRTRGRVRELLPNLEGTVSAESRNGRVMKFALLGNILSLKGVSDLLKEGESKVDSAGFPYRSLSAAGRFAGGRFIIDESAFDSPAVGLAATGWISLTDYGSRLSVLVAPFARVDRLARKVPILGYILGGALTSIPVGVSGDIRDPLVVPLGPSAVTSELLGIFKRTLKLPGKLVPSQGGEALAPPSAPP
jgi:hypothetical protein